MKIIQNAVPYHAFLCLLLLTHYLIIQQTVEVSRHNILLLNHLFSHRIKVSCKPSGRFCVKMLFQKQITSPSKRCNLNLCPFQAKNTQQVCVLLSFTRTSESLCAVVRVWLRPRRRRLPVRIQLPVFLLEMPSTSGAARTPTNAAF
jgi:hypothetical protein